MRFFNLEKQKNASLFNITMLQQELGNAYKVVFRSDNEIVGLPVAFHHDANAGLVMKASKIKVVAISLSKDGHQVVSFFHNLFLTDSIQT